MAEAQLLLIDRPADGVAVLTLNRPEVLNAVDLDLARRLKESLNAFAVDDSVRAIVLTGAGDRAFSAGYDIHEMGRLDISGMEMAYIERDPIVWQIASHPKPIIAALNGLTWGIGALYAAAADIRVGCQRSTFRVTATMYGGANGTFSLPSVVGVAWAKDLLLTGRELTSSEMREMGLITRLVEDHAIVTESVELASMIAANPSTGPYWVKRQINENIGRPYVDRWRYEFVTETAHTMPEDVGPGSVAFEKFLSTRRRD